MTVTHASMPTTHELETDSCTRNADPTVTSPSEALDLWRQMDKCSEIVPPSEKHLETQTEPMPEPMPPELDGMTTGLEEQQRQGVVMERSEPVLQRTVVEITASSPAAPIGSFAEQSIEPKDTPVPATEESDKRDGTSRFGDESRISTLLTHPNRTRKVTTVIGVVAARLKDVVHDHEPIAKAAAMRGCSALKTAFVNGATTAAWALRPGPEPEDDDESLAFASLAGQHMLSPGEAGVFAVDARETRWGGCPGLRSTFYKGQSYIVDKITSDGRFFTCVGSYNQLWCPAAATEVCVAARAAVAAIASARDDDAMLNGSNDANGEGTMFGGTADASSNNDDIQETSWRVVTVAENHRVRQFPIVSSAEMGRKRRGAVVSGTRQGDWIALTEGGYMLITDGAATFMELEDDWEVLPIGCFSATTAPLVLAAHHSVQGVEDEFDLVARL